ncbi:MAG: glycerol-3-phosphate dehydrogenase/oxidase [Vulcanimicrobiota bacterium]
MKRESLLARLGSTPVWDMIFIGGGATGVGAAVDAAARGYTVLLLEQSDFGKGTSSRSTKLVHGGVRYLEQGNVSLVMEALRERGLLLKNAPHLVGDLQFVVPNYTWWEGPYFGLGLKVYDLLSGRHSFGASRWLGKADTMAHLPTIKTEGLRGGVLYHDGQFNDSRLLVNLVQTGLEKQAVTLNYCRVTALLKDAQGLVEGVTAIDLENDASFQARARVVINCTGPFTDELRQLDQPESRPIISPSTGVHVVLDRRFLPTETGLMVPRTKDGRVLFAIPWNNSALLGTTDQAVDAAKLEPEVTRAEVDFILETARGYLAEPPGLEDVRSVFSGIRPLVKADKESTSALSRDHTIAISKSGLITICGGKWTTYRKMAEDVVDRAELVGGFAHRPCVTENLMVHGGGRSDTVYGSDQALIDELGLGEQLHPKLDLTAGQVVWAVRHELARTVEDVLSRRVRALLFDAAAAVEAAPRVAELMADELGFDQSWRERQCRQFQELARGYQAASLY